MLTGPGAEHRKFVFAAVGAVNWPLGADHWYVRLAGIGPVAVAERETGLPTAVSFGLALTEFQAAQSKDVPPIIAVWPAAAEIHTSCTWTVVVACGSTANDAEPSQSTPPSTDAAERRTR
jgi:hypothetical protein